MAGHCIGRIGALACKSEKRREVGEAIDKASLDSENDIMVSKRASCNERSDNGCSLKTSSEETNKMEETDPKKVTFDRNCPNPVFYIRHKKALE